MALCPRYVASMVRWDKLAWKIPKAPRASIMAIKDKTYGYIRSISLPEKLPTTDWTSYKNMAWLTVDTIQEKALEVSYTLDRGHSRAKGLTRKVPTGEKP